MTDDDDKPQSPNDDRGRRIRETVDNIAMMIMGDRDKAKASAVTIVIAMSKGFVPNVRLDLGP